MREDGIAMFPCVKDGALEITLVENTKRSYHGKWGDFFLIPLSILYGPGVLPLYRCFRQHYRHCGGIMRRWTGSGQCL